LEADLTACRYSILDQVGGPLERAHHIPGDGAQCEARQSFAGDAHETEHRIARLPPVEAERQRPLGCPFAGDREMIAEDPKRRVVDIVERPACENERGARAIDFLTNLAGWLAIDIQILDRKGERAVDMAVADIVLGDRLFGERIGIKVPRSVERIFAIFADQ
jgi:hypothetical protein